MNPIFDILKHNWGYDKFRPLQEEIINSVLEGKHTLALLPTGGGKSICFQVPALALEGICIVVTPLIALMKDQVEQLKRRRIKAIAIYSGMNNREIDIALDNCIYGDVKFLYVSPERLKTDLFIERAKRMKVSLLAVDEAHCISQWGYDFRPAYLEIAAFKTHIPGAKLIALTASATANVVKDITEKLEFKDIKIFKKSFRRENLSYSCLYEENKSRKLIQILKNVTGSSIVYVRSRKRTKSVAIELSRAGITAEYYHAGLSNDERNKRQDAWIKNKVRVMVATNAFGMGIDKPDVRTVIHLDVPDSLEAYYQEAGRAGRDEQKAYAVILYDRNDLLALRSKVVQQFPDPAYLRKVYQSLANYFKIAVGSSNLASFEFLIEDFQRVFDLTPVSTYYAIKKLEEEGFVQLNESFYNPSKIFISIDNKSLYEYIIAHPQHDQFIKTILRMYGGELFSNFISISEAEIARNLNTSLNAVFQILNNLSQKSIMIYEPKKDKPQLTFTTPRYDASKLPLNEKNLEERKRRSLHKMEKMISYTEHIYKCRTSLIVEYFDETPGDDCGVCDNCLNKKKVKNDGEDMLPLREKILILLKHTAMTHEEVEEKAGVRNRELLVNCLRTMISNSELEYNENGKLQLI